MVERRLIQTDEQMVHLGKQLAKNLLPGDLVMLDGPVGAGKTTLTKGIGLGLGISEPITSPTFVISRVHHGPTGIDLVHVDAYRLGSITEVDSLDLETSLADSITVVEWGAGLISGLTDDHWLIEIARDLEPETELREVKITAPKNRELKL